MQFLFLRDQAVPIMIHLQWCKIQDDQKNKYDVNGGPVGKWSKSIEILDPFNLLSFTATKVTLSIGKTCAFKCPHWCENIHSIFSINNIPGIMLLGRVLQSPFLKASLQIASLVRIVCGLFPGWVVSGISQCVVRATTTNGWIYSTIFIWSSIFTCEMTIMALPFISRFKYHYVFVPIQSG
jgi:hypothetical protein